MEPPLAEPEPRQDTLRTRAIHKIQSTKIGHVLSYRDFRMLWLGAFFSFIGTQVQNLAQGYMVYEMTHDASKLAFVSLCSSLPVAIFGPFAGTFADLFDKKKVLVFTQTVLGLAAGYLAIATHYGFAQYWHIVITALFVGAASCIDAPARQSVVSRVVPAEDLSKAIPVNAMTFNSARIFGPALGAILLSTSGYSICFAVNAMSYLALIFGVLSIRTSLKSEQKEAQPIGDVLFEGMLYTFKNIHLRTLFILESFTAIFGLFYISLMPAIAREMFGLQKKGLGFMMTAIGVGALLGLVTNMTLADRPYKATLIRVSMTVVAVALTLFGLLGIPPGQMGNEAAMIFSPRVLCAYVLLMLVGLGAIMQFNTTNTLFQLISPPNLRGRALAMHLWTLSGVSPIGVMLFGQVAQMTKHRTDLPVHGVQLSVLLGGILMLFAAAYGWLNKKGFEGMNH